MRLGILGRTHLLYNAVPRLREAGHDIAFILTCTESPEYSRTASDFMKLARDLQAPFRCDDRINRPDMIEWLRSHRADAAFSVNWRTIIGPDVLGLFPRGIVNVHAGDLPRYRGNATPNWAILNGEKRIFLTAHLMVEELDAGPVLARRAIPIDDTTYIGDLYDRFGEETPELLVEVATGLAEGTITPEPQSPLPQDVLRCYPRLARDGEIDWRESASAIARLVRASAEPFAGAYTWLGIERIVIWRARPVEADHPYLGTPGQVASVNTETGLVTVVTGEGLLALDEVEAEGHTRCRAAAHIKRVRLRLGMDVTAEISRLHRRIEELTRRDP
jgi:UDP-4-amino-4-deoxy-L-arabinose formyltransferase/UDP-glucuronic acid dehydrogenase (UDP-4-keto-hexauronic acid decarboxylating)